MDIVTLAAARKGGGSGGDVTKQYVDEHLALKADKSETQQYPIGGNVSGDAISVSDSADANVQNLTIYGRSEVVEGDIESIGDSGELDVQTRGKNLIDQSKFVQGTINSYGIDSPATNRLRSPFIEVKPGMKYSISVDSTLLCYEFHEYGSDQSWYGGTVINAVSGTKQVSENTKFIKILIRKSDNSTTLVSELQHFMLELSSTATAYEPYISTSAEIATSLPLCGIPVTSDETYTDGDGVKWLADTASDEGVVKRLGVVTLTGAASETYSQQPSWPNKGCFFGSQLLPGAKDVSGYNVKANILSNLGETTTPESLAAGFVTQGVGYGATYTFFLSISSGVTTIEQLREYLAANPVTIVYELATPTTTPLTNTEKQELLSLETYEPVTNVDITDDPFVDISYIKNTNNGQAAEQLADNLRASIGWIFAVPEMHRNIFRGQSLGSTVTAAQLAAIEDGSFDDLYIGDYWTINNTVYRIADMDFYWQDASSNFPFETHHLAIVPDYSMYNAKMNDNSATTSGGYKNSDMRTTNLSAAKTTINADFPNMVLTYKDYLVTSTSGGYPSGGGWYDCDIELMSETMMYGCTLFAAQRATTPEYPNIVVNPSQFSLFRLNPKYLNLNRGTNFWLRDTANSDMFCTMEVPPMVRNANTEQGVRPFFLIGDAT